MIKVMEKNTIITMKLKGKSNRWISRETGLNRKTVARYWNNYQELNAQMEQLPEKRLIQEEIASGPKYNATSRTARKYTPEMDMAIDEILRNEATKIRELGESHKQRLTIVQIYELLRKQGHEIGITTVSNQIKKKREKKSETYIRQSYEYGERLEYDFGEVRLVIKGKAGKYYLAVFGAPRSSFRWAYLYSNQKKEVFLDSHVRFFDMVGGAYREVVYDNMRNVVSAFIGRNEKELNADLIGMSNYYGFSINVTNCFRGNEKGYVESSVKKIRNEAFALRYHFENISEAAEYLEGELIRINEKSTIEEEQAHLLPRRPPLELSRITEQVTDKYSFVRVENNFYSVPEYLTQRKVTVRIYAEEIVVYSGLHEVCRHPKKSGNGEMAVNIKHYLDTLLKKPGAVRNANALKNEHELKSVFDKYYDTRVREFIEIIRTHQHRPIPEIVQILQSEGEGKKVTEKILTNVMRHTQGQLNQISDFFMKGKVV